MIPGSKGHTFHACMKKYDFGTRKQKKVARIGRISNVFRIAGAQSAEQSVGIVGTKYIKDSPDKCQMNLLLFFVIILTQLGELFH